MIAAALWAQSGTALDSWSSGSIRPTPRSIREAATLAAVYAVGNEIRLRPAPPVRAPPRHARGGAGTQPCPSSCVPGCYRRSSTWCSTGRCSWCKYRHSDAARVNLRDCWDWFNGNCVNLKCSFSHQAFQQTDYGHVCQWHHDQARPHGGALGSRPIQPTRRRLGSGHSGLLWLSRRRRARVQRTRPDAHPPPLARAGCPAQELTRGAGRCFFNCQPLAAPPAGRQPRR
ncbi:uncharacterized protein [Triticum aestivum]|uniref:uncharacterized protein n=1 Tax=Triticum aestivum TaxID=4565 RepID=UPI001D034D64|nr:uncharacterized protein LOC123117583 [Triticum aestivum]